MPLTGKKVIHRKYGRGVITSYSHDSETIWVRFPGESADKYYEIPKDFDSGLLKGDDDFNQYFDNRPQKLYSAEAIGERCSSNKDLIGVYENCRAILEDIHLQPAVIDSVTLMKKSTGKMGHCHINGTNTQNVHCRIEINPVLMGDEIRDVELYETMLHELLHACAPFDGHGRIWKSYAERVNSLCGYQISVRTYEASSPTAMAAWERARKLVREERKADQSHKERR